MIANGSDEVYFGTSSDLEIQAVIDDTSTEVITESQTTEGYRTVSRIELSITLDISTGNQPMSWNSTLFNKFSELYNSTAEKTCDLIKASPRFITSIKYRIPTCTVLRFYPGSVKSDVQIIVEYIDEFNVTQTQILQAIQLGSQLYVIEQSKNQTINSSQILSFTIITQKETCSTIASKCSPYADCIETLNGAKCVCRAMWIDINQQQPGEQCIISPVVVALIIVAAVLFILIFTLGVYFSLRTSRNNQRYMYSFA
ncbi:hypothetical protein MN116_005094 [Schistosoma mekongi]|uniref:SEA domain-containing protein n=1 Tax=Schistosoma mekongi TaxID=38744 RepID=A0AAE1ZD45_SCHME|nr:hypothetical protein MN116_005094 [Schistosoma mekongi]